MKEKLFYLRLYFKMKAKNIAYKRLNLSQQYKTIDHERKAI
jgi:hypothetical protein